MQDSTPTFEEKEIETFSYLNDPFYRRFIHVAQLHARGEIETPKNTYEEEHWYEKGVSLLKRKTVGLCGKSRTFPASKLVSLLVDLHFIGGDEDPAFFLDHLCSRSLYNGMHDLRVRKYLSLKRGTEYSFDYIRDN